MIVVQKVGIMQWSQLYVEDIARAAYKTIQDKKNHPQCLSSILKLKYEKVKIYNFPLF